jgi:hypothetical protein
MSANNERHSVSWGKERIEFRLRRSERRTLGITVQPDLSVTVTAPEAAGIERIIGKVGERAKWIQKQQGFFRDFLPTMPPRRYVSGETHRYLGRQYRLRVVVGNRAEVKLKGGYIWTTLPEKSTRQVQALLEIWYAERAAEHLGRSYAKCVRRLKTFLEHPPAMRLRRMPKRWGSWTQRGGVWLNPELVKMPVSCIDYVATHELCHALQGNHGRKFYDLLLRVMPDWEARKVRLERAAAEAGVPAKGVKA